MKKIICTILTLIMIISLCPQAFAVTALDISKTPALYSGFDYSDPQWISDSDFFGEWDSSQGKWIKEPVLNYDKYAALSDTENAVKLGDYSLAKEKITAYYKNKFLNQPRTIETTFDNKITLTARLEAYNCFFLGSAAPLDWVEFSTSKASLSADIIQTVKEAAKDSSLKLRTFEVCAIEQGAAAIDIDSRESTAAPYVKATVNGKEKTFPVIRDAYIRGGSYENTNYGSAASLRVCENTDYFVAEQAPIYTDNPKEPDYTNTSRARMTVDFTGLSSGDSITSAKLVMSGKSTSGKKKCVVFSNTNGDMPENKWTWKDTNRVFACFGGQRGPLVYKGNFDQTQQHPFENYEALYKVYRARNDENYAYHAFRLYNNYIKAYGHTACSHTKLDMGTRGSALPEILAYLAPSTHFNAENFIPILKYAYTLGQGTVSGWDKTAETGNWGLYGTAGLANLAINFKEFKIAEAPMIEGGSYGRGNSGGWKAVVMHRYGILSETLLREDKSFHETLEYADESLSRYLDYYEYSKEAGEENDLDGEIKQNLIDFGKYIIDATGPDFVDYQIGDAAWYQKSFQNTLEKLAEITGDSYLKWAGSGKKDGTPPDHTSAIYPVNRKACLKTGWDSDDIYIDFTSDQSIASHNHPDDLNVVMFAYGQYLLTDQKQFSYTEDSPERNWVYSTQAHNTLAIPGVAHKAEISGIHNGARRTADGGTIVYNHEEASPGTIHESELNQGYDYIEMSHPNYEDYVVAGVKYADVNCDRSLLLLKKGKYVIVNDFVKALSQNDYIVQQNWHMLPEANISMTNGIAKSNFSGANIQIVPALGTNTEAKLLDGYYSPENEKLVECKYAAYEQGGSGDKTFCTVLLPTKAGESITASASRISLDVADNKADAFSFTMTGGSEKTETSYYRLHDKSAKARRTFGDYSTDAELALAEKTDGEYSQYILRRGKILRDKSKTLIKSTKTVDELSVITDGGNMEISSSKNIDIDSLTLYGENVTSVTVNGENTEFLYKDGYVYFKESEPLSNEVYPPLEEKFVNGFNVNFTPDEENSGIYSVSGGDKEYASESTAAGIRLKALNSSDGHTLNGLVTTGFEVPAQYAGVSQAASANAVYYHEFTVDMSKLADTSKYRIQVYNADYEKKCAFQLELTKATMEIVKSGLGASAIPQEERSSPVKVAVASKYTASGEIYMAAYLNDRIVIGPGKAAQTSDNLSGYQPTGRILYYFHSCSENDELVIKNYKGYRYDNGFDMNNAPSGGEAIRKITFSLDNKKLVLPDGRDEEYTAQNVTEAVALPGLTLSGSGTLTVNGGKKTPLYWGTGAQHLHFWELTADISDIASEDAFRITIKGNRSENGGSSKPVATVSVGRDLITASYRTDFEPSQAGYIGEYVMPEEPGEVRIGLSYDPETYEVMVFADGNCVLKDRSNVYAAELANTYSDGGPIVITSNGGGMLLKKLTGGYIKKSDIDTDGILTATVPQLTINGEAVTAVTYLSKSGNAKYSETAVLYVAVYAADKSLKSVDKQSLTVKGGDSGKELSKTVTGYTAGCSVKAFVWKGAMIPVI